MLAYAFKIAAFCQFFLLSLQMLVISVHISFSQLLQLTVSS